MPLAIYHICGFVTFALQRDAASVFALLDRTQSGFRFGFVCRLKSAYPAIIHGR
jgi:hypothetical protein